MWVLFWMIRVFVCHVQFDLNNQFDNNKNILDFFNYYIYNLFDSYNNILGYHKYSNWLNLYNINKELLDFNKQLLTKID
jgi:hypothetical protein